MAEEDITLVSQNYVTDKFQSKLTEENQGDNIKITLEGDLLKINAEVPDPTTIKSSDESIKVTPTETGYDLKVDDNKFIGRGEYTMLTDKVDELEEEVGKNTTDIGDLGLTVSTVQGNIRDLNTQVTAIENEVNTLDRGKQDTLTAGANITISADNVISATGVLLMS